MSIGVDRNTFERRVVGALQSIVQSDSAALTAPLTGTGSAPVAYAQTEHSWVKDRMAGLVNGLADNPVLITGVDNTYLYNGTPITSYSGGLTDWDHGLENAAHTGLQAGAVIAIVIDITGCGGTGYCALDLFGKPINFPVDVLLFHELAHAFHLANNDFSKAAPEPQAENDENQLRSEKGMTKRDPNSHYGSCCGVGQCPDCPCLIVTAATGTDRSVEVESLRQLRDRVLRQSPLGDRFFVALFEEYYRFSPLVANDMEASDRFKEAVYLLGVTPLLDFLRLLEEYLRGGWQRPGHFLDSVERSVERSRQDLLLSGVTPSAIATLAAGAEGLASSEIPIPWIEELPGIGEPQKLVAYIGQRMRGGRFTSWGLLRPLAIYWRALGGGAGDFVARLEAWLPEFPLSGPVTARDTELLAGTILSVPVLREVFQSGPRQPAAADGNCGCWD